MHQGPFDPGGMSTKFYDAQRGEDVMPDYVEEFLSNYPEEIRKISRELRNMARKAMPGAHEFLYHDVINYSLSDSPLDRICYISPTQKHVALGLLFGAQLDDQHRLLQGTSKRARHINIRTLEDARNPALRDLVKVGWNDGPDSVTRMKQKMRQRRAQLRRRAKMRRRAAIHRPTKRAPRSRRRRR